jgi:GT2 family glycosyltransferase
MSTISIVVAAWRDTAGLAECLESLAAQRADSTEVLVICSAPPGEPVQALQRRHAWARWFPAPAHGLIPHLWAIGMRAAANDVVAITTAHFRPAADWVEQIRQAFARHSAAGVGGRIDPPRGGRLVDWATYFQRYNAYLHLDREQPVGDIAGDNAAYRRAELLRHPQCFTEGFWEPDFHRLLLNEGKTLLFIPSMRITQTTSFGFRRFLRQRFVHAIQFGQARMRGRGWGYRLAGLLASPLIPLLFGAKIARRVLASGRDIGAFMLSLPILGCFLMAWGAGEACGYLLPERKDAQKVQWA